MWLSRSAKRGSVVGSLSNNLFEYIGFARYFSAHRRGIATEKSLSRRSVELDAVELAHVVHVVEFCGGAGFDGRTAQLHIEQLADRLLNDPRRKFLRRGLG